MTVRPRDTVEEAIGDRRMQRAASGEENVGAGTFSNAPLPVEHHGVGITAPLGAMFGDRADHVEARGLGGGWRRLRIGAAIFGDIEPDALHLLFDVELAGPCPHGNRRIDRRILRCDSHHLATAPGNGAHITIREVVLIDDELLGRVQFGDGIGNFEIEHIGGAF